MNFTNILSRADHTQLKQIATNKDIKKLIDEAIEYKVASVCIPPSYVKFAVDYAKGQIPICTVIGFPNGYQTIASKVFETKEAIENGAEEIDMVININELKNQNYDYVLNEIKEIKNACGEKILKVIIETCLLTEDEKIKMCEMVSESGADFIKTSTGFSTAGATIEDIKLFKKYLGNHVKMKAAGGIDSLEIAQEFVELGVDRLGTSRVIKFVQDELEKEKPC